MKSLEYKAVRMHKTIIGFIHRAHDESYDAHTTKRLAWSGKRLTVSSSFDCEKDAREWIVKTFKGGDIPRHLR